MENIKIREATLLDIKETARIITMTWKEVYNGIVPSKKLAELSSLNFISYLEDDIKSDDKTVFVSENEFQAVVGMISGGAIKQEVEGYDAEIYAMYVMPDMQGKGIGQSLFNELVAWLKTHNFKKFVAWVLKDNVKARDFYGKAGGQVVAQGDIEIGEKKLETVCYGWDLSGMALQTKIVSEMPEKSSGMNAAAGLTATDRGDI